MMAKWHIGPTLMLTASATLWNVPPSHPTTRSSGTNIEELQLLTNTLIYKDYHVKVGFDDSANEFHGCAIGIKDVIDFYGKTPADLKREFQNSVDAYLDWCQSEAKEPDKSRPAVG
jgi:hypothetical protein